MGNMKLCMLIDDKRLNKTFKREHGMSLYIETENQKILFDTGASRSFIDNAKLLGIEIDKIDIVILSHGHKDHTGGLVGFLNLNSKAKVIMKNNGSDDFYVKFCGLKKNISTPSVIFKQHQQRIEFLNDNRQIANSGIFIVANFIEKYPLVKSNTNLLRKRAGKLMSDNFDHELALVIRNHGKLVVICGCSHSGVENIVETIKLQFPGEPIQMLLGGFHLMDFPRNLIQENEEDIIKLAKRLQEYDIEQIYTCHCTGRRAFHILKKEIGDKFSYFSTGSTLEL